MMTETKTILSESKQIALLAPAEGATAPLGLRAAFEGKSVEAASVEAQSELAALSAMAAARQGQLDSQGAARGIGLLGADPGADLAAARKAFSLGDMAKARSLADGARAAWEGANSSGQARILGGSALGIALLLLLLALIVSPRRAAAVVPVRPARRKRASSSS
jgi:hypothetical protein